MTSTIDVDAIAANVLGDTPYDLLINGVWQPAAGGASFPVTNPATGELLTTVPDAGARETSAAIDAAAAAFPGWAATPAPTRAAILRKVAALLIEHQERLATILTLEQGKPMVESRGEMVYSASFFNWCAGEAERVYGHTIPASTANKRLIMFKQPVGVVALITPWNFPTGMLARKIATALAAGCTVVCKPAEQTPLSAYELGKLCIEAGVPAGVVNIITCQDPIPFSDTIFADERVRKISFTGSTEVGKILIRNSAPSVKRLSLELGGHAPFIAFGDADLEAAVQGAIASKFRNAGQTCICSNRLFVHRSIYDAFAERFTAEVANMPIGNGLKPGTLIGPLIDQPAVEKAARHTADAKAGGAEILLGGNAWTDEPGTFWAPTILANVRHDMLVAREETFGPVAPLLVFDEEDEAIAMANDTSYGLAAYFYTRDVSRVFRVGEKLEYGIIGVNDAMPSTVQAPFGGVKQSGLGREGGPNGIDEYLDVKYLALGL